jgi:hypothetical protein
MLAAPFCFAAFVQDEVQDLSTVEALHFLRLSQVRQDVVEVVLDPMEVFCER